MATAVPTVGQAVAQIMAELPGIGKDEQMGSGQYGYAYRGIDTITRHVQPLLAKHGVVIAPRSTLVSMQPALDAKPGWQDVILSVEWTITGPDGSQLTAQTIGIGRDNADKGANKAQSQAYKYLLLQLLCIADKADDSDGVDYSGSHADTSRRPPAGRNGSHRTGLSPQEPQHDEVAERVYARLKECAGTPIAADMKAWAAEQGKELKLAALTDHAWADMVTDRLDTTITQRALMDEGVTA